MDHTGRRTLVLLASVVLVMTASAVVSTLVAARTGDEPSGVLGGSGESPQVAAPAVPVPGGPGFYAQSALLFRPYSSSDVYAYLSAQLWNPGAATAWYEGALSLPNGATVTRFVVYYYDNHATHNLEATLIRAGLAGGDVSPMAKASSPIGSAGYGYAETVSITHAVIDQQSYAYVAEVKLPASNEVRLVGVRIDYAYTISLPLVTKE
jgi:hypothetical protein